jgi:hypothetical protein
MRSCHLFNLRQRHDRTRRCVHGSIALVCRWRHRISYGKNMHLNILWYEPRASNQAVKHIRTTVECVKTAAIHRDCLPSQCVQRLAAAIVAAQFTMSENAGDQLKAFGRSYYVRHFFTQLRCNKKTRHLQDDAEPLARDICIQK